MQNEMLSLDTLDPSTASDSVSYQWEYCDTENGEYFEVLNATDDEYILTANEVGKYVRLTVIGGPSTLFQGLRLSSEPIGPVEQAGQAALIWIRPVGGSVNDPIVAGITLEAIVDPTLVRDPNNWNPYSFWYSDSLNGSYTQATNYNGIYLNPSYIGKYIRARFAASSGYVESTPVMVSPASLSIVLSKKPSSDNQINLTYAPEGAWTNNITWSIIDGKTGGETPTSAYNNQSYYALSGAEYGNYLKAVAIGQEGSFYATFVAEKIIPILKPSISLLSGSTELSLDGVEAPDGAGYTLQWQYAASNPNQDQSFTNIAGQTGNSYQLQPGDVGKYIRVAAICTETGMVFGSNCIYVNSGFMLTAMDNLNVLNNDIGTISMSISGEQVQGTSPMTGQSSAFDNTALLMTEPNVTPEPTPEPTATLEPTPETTETPGPTPEPAPESTATPEPTPEPMCTPEPIAMPERIAMH